jgi:hypothetical protein
MLPYSAGNTTDILFRRDASRIAPTEPAEQFSRLITANQSHLLSMVMSSHGLFVVAMDNVGLIFLTSIKYLQRAPTPIRAFLMFFAILYLYGFLVQESCFLSTGAVATAVRAPFAFPVPLIKLKCLPFLKRCSWHQGWHACEIDRLPM